MTKKKWLVIGTFLVLILLALVALGGLSGAMAFFTDTETLKANVITAGTMGSSTGCRWQDDVSKVKPGDHFVFEFTLQSDGNLPFNYNVVPDLSGELASGDNPCYVNWVKIDSALSTTCSGSLNSSGDSDLIKVEVVMPEKAGSEYEGKSGQLEVTIHATQQ